MSVFIATFIYLTLKLTCLGSALAVAQTESSTGYQVHLSLAGSPANAYVITWLTNTTVAMPIVALEAGLLRVNLTATTETFVDGGSLHRTQYVHRATTPVLEAGHIAMYHCTVDDKGTFTPLLRFRTVEAMGPSSRFTLYGDFGLTNPVSLPNLLTELEQSRSDVLVHIGDFAYDMQDENATRGDAWFNLVEPIYSAQPVMVVPGNHEAAYDFLNYRKRFSMPQRSQTNNYFYSWDFGPVHWVAYNTEAYFEPSKQNETQEMLAFVEKDLQQATARRKDTPWIVAYGHRPMYCSAWHFQGCSRADQSWKQNLEDLFYKYEVDLVFEGHAHAYERLWPVYNLTVLNGTEGDPYHNARAPIHVITGAAGCDEFLHNFSRSPKGPWSAVRVLAYGIAHLDVHNATHAYIEQIFTPNGSVADSFWVTKG